MKKYIRSENSLVEYIYLSLYLVSMFLVASYMMVTSKYTGEFSDFEVEISYFELFYLLSLCSLGFIFSYIFYIRTKSIKTYFFSGPWKINSVRLACIFYFLVLTQLTFLIYTDVGRVGSQAVSEYSPIFSVLSVDALFGFFYILIREDKNFKKKYFWAIVLTYLIYKLFQGWSGIILVIFFFELHFYCRNKNRNPWSKVIITVFFPLFLILAGGKLYQYVFPYKFEIRGKAVSEINYTDSVVNLTNRLTFFPVAVGAFEKSDQLKANALIDETSFREIKGFFRPFVPRFLLDNKEFRSINNLVVQAFYPDVESATSSDIGLIMYIYTVFSTDIIGAMFLMILIPLLIFINKCVIDNFEQYKGQLNFLYFLLIMKVYYTSSPEIVFGYGFMGVVILLPLLFVFGAVKIKKNSVKNI
jgi:ABC-type multidrug transport system fused ATPase/permease subunit